MDFTVATTLPFRPQLVTVLSNTGEILRFVSMLDHPTHVANSRDQQLWVLSRNPNEVKAAFSRCLLDGVTTQITLEGVSGRLFRAAFVRMQGMAAVIVVAELEEQAHVEDVTSELSSQLTERQLEICKLQCDGVNTKEIGRRLEISESAINSHRNAAMEILKCTTREQLGAMLARAGLV